MIPSQSILIVMAGMFVAFIAPAVRSFSLGWTTERVMRGQLRSGKCFTTSKRLYSKRPPHVKDVDPEIGFARGNKIQVEVIRFGRLGASVDVIARGHHEDDIVGDDDESLATGLILQREIQYFRQSRGLDVVAGEILPAYVESIREIWRDDDFGEPQLLRKSLDISLRPIGGAGKAKALSVDIIDKLNESEDLILPIGDKSSPDEIAKFFPGTSKSAFKKAVGLLYREGKVNPGPHEISLIQ